MTVVVTGANGHVGANLVRTLLEEGRSVQPWFIKTAERLRA